jgi:SAM-dependent methyltransferase
MRDYTRFDEYLNRLAEDIYPQPPDLAHTAWTVDFITWLKDTGQIHPGMSFLDIGCGQAIARSAVSNILQCAWSGVTLGEDWEEIKDISNTYQADMSFLPFEDSSFDIVYARHALEHSPFPFPTLMEWHRVSKKWLALVMPAPEFWGFRGKNHYSVMTLPHLYWALARSGWTPIAEQEFKQNNSRWKEFNPEAEIDPRHPLPVEYRLLCMKGVPSQI